MSNWPPRVRTEIRSHEGSKEKIGLEELRRWRCAGPNSHYLRWGVVSLSGTSVQLETITGVHDEAFPETINNLESSSLGHFDEGLTVAVVIPTGVGSAIGGFIGDAGPFVQAVAAVSKAVIVHPNVVNGSDLFGGNERCIYVDGLTLDRFFSSRVRLVKGKRVPKVGLLLDKLSPEAENSILNAANAMVAVRGCNLASVAICDERIHSRVERTPFGHFVGEILNPRVLVGPATALEKAGVDCIAMVSDVTGPKETDWLMHYKGAAGGVNPIGAVEAMLSRLVTAQSGLPCAHAPALVQFVEDRGQLVDSRAAAELISVTGLPCILEGFRRMALGTTAEGLHVGQLDAIVAPAGAVGGEFLLAANDYQIPLVSIREASTEIGLSSFSIDCPQIVEVNTAAEALGFLCCLRSGVSWKSIHRLPRPADKT